MQISDLITLGGAAVTIVAMAVSIIQAKNALRDSRAATTAVSKFRLAANADRLKSAQQYIRNLPLIPAEQRGVQAAQQVSLIRQEFDSTLGALPMKGPGSDVRRLLTDAQANLDAYEASLTTPLVNRAAWQSLQSSVQDAVSILTTVSSEPGVSA